jgi:hypothetical protein
MNSNKGNIESNIKNKLMDTLIFIPLQTEGYKTLDSVFMLNRAVVDTKIHQVMNTFFRFAYPNQQINSSINKNNPFKAWLSIEIKRSIKTI